MLVVSQNASFRKRFFLTRWHYLPALLFAEVCAEADLPPGVFNVVTGDGRMGSMLATHPKVDKVGFTGSTEVRKALLQTGLSV